MDWKCDLRGKVSALKAQSPEFKPQSHQMEKKPKKTKHGSVCSCSHSRDDQLSVD
jgi:hypothetical protein